MHEPDRNRVIDAVTAASAALVAIAIRSVASGTADVTVAQHRVLVLVAAHRALTVNELASGLGVDQSNASRYCSRLVGLGLLSRTRAHHDRRAVELRLTPDGEQQVRAVHQARRQEIERVLADLPDAAAYELAGALEAFNRAADEIVATTEV